MSKSPKTPVTAEMLRTFMTDGMEPAEPAGKILAFLKANEGKKLTKREEKKMQDMIDPSIRIRHVAGMTNLEWGGYGRTGGTDGGSLLIAYNAACPEINAAWVEERNAWAYSARVERNEARTKALRDATESMTGATTFTRAAVAINAIRSARVTLASLTEYGGPLHEIRSEIDRLLKDD